MASDMQELMLAAFAGNTLPTEQFGGHRALFEQNRSRILAIAFWMTDNELVAEGLMRRTFLRALTAGVAPSKEGLDRALVAELRALVPIGALTLECTPPPHPVGMRYNTLRIHLERAVVQLPPTERLIFVMHDVDGYSHARIAGLLDISEVESQFGLHQARLRVRELVAAMEHAPFAAAC